jgi:N utilization substance protein A
MKGSRVQSIIRELRGEKIDIIEYSDDLVTFAQSALAPAKITRVSVTHSGDLPHLDVIVEDEQLSLAIGKRGQNVRLASELIGSRIDIKSESDVKDEVADALARMLQSALGGDSASGATVNEMSVAAAPGVDAELATRLLEAGIPDAEALAEADLDTLLSVEGMDEGLAESLQDWASAQLREREEKTGAEIGALFRTTEKPTASMGDEDFMAALSRAFQESEQQRASRSGDEGGAAEDGGGEEPREE